MGKSAKSANVPVFAPIPKERAMKNVLLECSLKEHENIKRAAHMYDMTMKDFMLQAIGFGMQHMASNGND